MKNRVHEGPPPSKIGSSEGIPCPHCGHLVSSTIESRIRAQHVRRYRRRVCSGCNQRYSTYEICDVDLDRLDAIASFTTDIKPKLRRLLSILDEGEA